MKQNSQLIVIYLSLFLMPSPAYSHVSLHHHVIPSAFFHWVTSLEWIPILSVLAALGASILIARSSGRSDLDIEVNP